MVNVSLNAAGSIMTIVRNNRPIIVSGTRNSHLAPSIMNFSGGKRELMKRLTGHRTISGPSHAIISVGQRVNRKGCGMGVSKGDCAPRRVSTVVLRGLGASTRTCLKRAIASTIVAYPTCFASDRHRTAGSTNAVTKLGILHVVGRPATSSLTCNLSGVGSNGRRHFLICSLNNNAFSISVLGLTSNMFRIRTSRNGKRLNNSSFSTHVVS